jgi:PAS domain S-box-containing protein
MEPLVRNINFLLAGHSTSYLEISKRMLVFHFDGSVVHFAHSGPECVEKAGDMTYDLILLDSGLLESEDVLSAVVRNAGESIIVVLLEEEQASSLETFISLGAKDVILKTRGYLTSLPFTVRHLLEKYDLLKRSRLDLKIRNGARKSMQGYFILDRKGRILSTNDALERVTEYSKEELLELSFVDLLPRDKERSFNTLLAENTGRQQPLRTEIFGKKGNKVEMDLSLKPIRDENQNVLSYRGELNYRPKNGRSNEAASQGIDQLAMSKLISDLITSSRDEPLGLFLERIAQAVCEFFHFQRATIALLDKRRRVFIKQAMVGYGKSIQLDRRNLEVPEEVIDRVFGDRFRVKVIYYNQDHRNVEHYLNSKFPERRSQVRRPQEEWHARDLVLLNLVDKGEHTFGYISLDQPEQGFVPKRDTFHNLEIFGQLTSLAIENYHQFSEVEKRHRRLKQILITSNIYKLYLSLTDLLKEMVWAVKFSLDFNLVMLGLISRKSGKLEIKAVACDNKVKAEQIRTLTFELPELGTLMKPENRSGKAYWIQQETPTLTKLKSIYRGSNLANSSQRQWPDGETTLLVPIKARNGSIIGAILVDDPVNGKMPGGEVVNMLEIMANQVAVAIDNRILYVQQKNRVTTVDGATAQPSDANHVTGRKSSNFRRFVDRFFN